MLPGSMGLGWRDGGVTVNICVSGLVCVCVMQVGSLQNNTICYEGKE